VLNFEHMFKLMSLKFPQLFEINYVSICSFLGRFPFGNTSRHKYLCYLLNAKKDKTIFVSTCVVTKWKASFTRNWVRGETR